MSVRAYVLLLGLAGCTEEAGSTVVLPFRADPQTDTGRTISASRSMRRGFRAPTSRASRSTHRRGRCVGKNGTETWDVQGLEGGSFLQVSEAPPCKNAGIKVNVP
ncbi:MAG: hypothetical protein SFX73_39710 [Kofleriaceae bacterium]|nr:hypothetical protein [Kofleriaceae bacterium]